MGQRSRDAAASLRELIDNLLSPAIRFALAYLASRRLQLEEAGSLVRKSGMIRQAENVSTATHSAESILNTFED